MGLVSGWGCAVSGLVYVCRCWSHCCWPSRIGCRSSGGGCCEEYEYPAASARTKPACCCQAAVNGHATPAEAAEADLSALT
jgi:hypothetical protein